MKSNLFNTVLFVFCCTFLNIGFTAGLVSGDTRNNKDPINKEEYSITQTTMFSQTTQEQLIEKMNDGEINWTDGYIIAYGKSEVLHGPDKSICYTIARRSAILKARTNAFKIIENMNLDGDMSMKSFFIKDSRWVYSFKSLISKAPLYEQCNEEGFYLVSIKIPFDGAHGIRSMLFYTDHVSKNGIKVPLTDDHRVIIDTTGLDLHPALFLKIKGLNGENVYTTKNTSLSILRNDVTAMYIMNITPQPHDTIIRALKVYGKQNGNIIIQSSDVETLRQHNIPYILIPKIQ
ncbi:MAG: hypothetical protein ACP5JP_04795 [bacterium]